jgi:sulfonate dioxygenase
MQRPLSLENRDLRRFTVSQTVILMITCSYALYSSLSPGMEAYLEGLAALHSAVAQAEGSRAAGLHIRREPIETVHPVVRVHPVTGWKSVYANPGVTRRILGVPKPEPDTTLNCLSHQVAENVDFQVRFHWEPNSTGSVLFLFNEECGV